MDYFGAIRAFVSVVQRGGFSAAAKAENTSQATVSKRLAALEGHLGVQLLRRTSRDQSLTQAGADYYENCLAILAELEEAEANARSQVAVPRGLLRVTGAFPLARLLIAPILPKFLAKYPEIRVDLVLTDKHVDLIGEGVDLAVRAQELPDSNLIARKLFDNPMYLVAAPGYLERFGTPKTPADLTEHNCLIYSRLDSVNVWHFSRKGRNYTVTVTGNLQCDNGDTLLESAIAGLGLLVLPYWMIHKQLDSGELQVVIQDYEPSPLPIHVVYPQRRFLPLKVRCFVEFLIEEFSADPVLR
jgi:DNA-binding transcriptional LysR family regulator